MFVRSIIVTEIFSNFSLNIVISLLNILCFHSVTIFLYIQKEITAKIQDMAMVDQQIVAINDQQIPIYIIFFGLSATNVVSH